MDGLCDAENCLRRLRLPSGVLCIPLCCNSVDSYPVYFKKCNKNVSVNR